MIIDYKNRKGMSLVEVIVSIALIGIISISILPMFVFSTKTNRNNEVKMNALNLAYSQIEWIKGKKYEDIEIATNETEIEKIFKDKYMNEDENPVINNIEYIVRTNISWQKANSPINGEKAEAIKKVEVIVEARKGINNKKKEYARLSTLISPEHEGKFQEPGNLYVYTYMKDRDNPISGLKIVLLKGEDIHKTIYTDSKGYAPFGNLEYGDYIISPIVEKQNLMFEPIAVEDNEYIWKRKVSVQEYGGDREIFYYGDKPVYLKVNYDSYPEFDSSEFSIQLQPYKDPDEDSHDYSANSNMKIEKTLEDIKNTKLWREWIYDYEVFGQCTDNKDNRYLLMDKESNIWNGEFDKSNGDLEQKEVWPCVVMDKESHAEITHDNGKEIIRITLKFSAPVQMPEGLEFIINGKESSSFNWSIEGGTENYNCSEEIIIKIEDDENKPDIKPKNEIEIKNPKNIKDQYGIELAPGASKSIIKIKR